MSIPKLLIFCLTLLITHTMSGIDFSRVNISWQYDPLAEIELRHRIIQVDDSITLYLRFRFDQTSDWTLEYLIQSGYESESHSRLKSYRLDTLISSEDKMILSLKFKKPAENLFVAKVFKEDAFYYYDVPLKNGALSHPSIYPIDQDGLPVFESYINTSKFSWAGSREFHATEYVENFEFADPPMGEMKPLAPSIMPDSSFQFFGTPTFKNNYFYIVRADSNASTGVTVVKTVPYFPELKRLVELSAPLVYILNEPERKGLYSSKNLKESFDSFWINTFKTKFRARNAIRNYFGSVRHSNRIFTDFKQGWKTDRGMLFIIYGVPDEVYRTNNEEEWYYDDGPAFEFSVISTFFSPRTYALRRQKDLEESWYEFIGFIRRGTND